MIAYLASSCRSRQVHLVQDGPAHHRPPLQRDHLHRVHRVAARWSHPRPLRPTPPPVPGRRNPRLLTLRTIAADSNHDARPPGRAQFAGYRWLLVVDGETSARLEVRCTSSSMSAATPTTPSRWRRATDGERSRSVSTSRRAPERHAGDNDTLGPRSRHDRGDPLTVGPGQPQR